MYVVPTSDDNVARIVGPPDAETAAVGPDILVERDLRPSNQVVTHIGPRDAINPRRMRLLELDRDRAEPGRHLLVRLLRAQDQPREQLRHVVEAADLLGRGPDLGVRLHDVGDDVRDRVGAVTGVKVEEAVHVGSFGRLAVEVRRRGFEGDRGGGCGGGDQAGAASVDEGLEDGV